MERSILFAAIAGAVLVGAVFAAIQPIGQAQTVHSNIGTLVCRATDVTGATGNFTTGALGTAQNDQFNAATNSCTLRT